jgi:hypothetical protein
MHIISIIFLFNSLIRVPEALAGLFNALFSFDPNRLKCFQDSFTSLKTHLPIGTFVVTSKQPYVRLVSFIII